MNGLQGTINFFAVAAHSGGQGGYFSPHLVYTSVDSIDNCDNREINEGLLPEYLNTLNPANLPPHELRLRTNCVVILIRNLSINEGLCDGT